MVGGPVIHAVAMAMITVRGGEHNPSPVGSESARMGESTAWRVHGVFLWGDRSRAAKNMFLIEYRDDQETTRMMQSECSQTIQPLTHSGSCCRRSNTWNSIHIQASRTETSSSLGTALSARQMSTRAWNRTPPPESRLDD